MIDLLKACHLETVNTVPNDHELDSRWLAVHHVSHYLKYTPDMMSLTDREHANILSALNQINEGRTFIIRLRRNAKPPRRA